MNIGQKIGQVLEAWNRLDNLKLHVGNRSKLIDWLFPNAKRFAEQDGYMRLTKFAYRHLPGPQFYADVEYFEDFPEEWK